MAKIDYQAIIKHLEKLMEINQELDTVNKELLDYEQEIRIERGEQPTDTMDELYNQGLRYLEFNKEGRLIKFWRVGKARDFRK